MNSRAAKHKRQMPSARKDPVRRGPAPQVLWVVGVVVVVVAIAIVVSLTGSTDSPTKAAISKYGRSPAPASLVAEVAAIPTSVISAVGAGTATAPTKTGQAASTAKPDFLFIGAEFCPYCAAERWALVNALSRFGTFTDLKVTHSSATDVNPNTPTFSFYQSKFVSSLLTFTPVEIATNEPNSGGAGYKTLESPTPAQQALWSKYSPQGGVPFASIGGQFVITGPTYAVGVLQGQTYDEIAAAMMQPDSAVAKGAVGAANSLTAAICITTKDLPATVCSNPGVKSIEATLK